MANGNDLPEKKPLDMKIEEEMLTEKKPEKTIEQFEEDLAGEDMKPMSMADFCEYMLK